MTLDIGIASYNNADKLRHTLEHLGANTAGEWRLLVVENASPEPAVKEVLSHWEGDPRVEVRWRQTNSGYAGAVNEILEWAEAERVAYVDNDCWVTTPGWDERLATLLREHHEVAMAFPGTYVSYPIERRSEGYTEVLWGVGCCWMLNRARVLDVGFFDTSLGHQEEVDYQLRLRMAGWRVAADPQVHVVHHGSSSADPASRTRINAGIEAWVNKWNRLTVGPQVTYHSPNVTRFEDWPVVSLYLEEYLRPHLPADLNAEPEQVRVDGQLWDLVKVPRWPHLYRNRTI